MAHEIPTHLPPTASSLSDLQQRLIALLDELRTVQPKSRDANSRILGAQADLWRAVNLLGEARACEQREELGHG